MGGDVDARLTTSRRRVNSVELEMRAGGAEDGPLVLLLHGFPDAWWTWRGQVGPLIDAGYRVVLPTMRGYGNSEKPAGIGSYALDTLAADVLAIADDLGRETFRLVGHDWGGVVAWEAAVRAPARIERLVIVDAPHPDVWSRVARRHPTQLLRSSYVAFFQLPWLPEAVFRARSHAVARGMLTRSSNPGTFTDHDLERYVEAWRQRGALTAMLNYYRALRHKPRRQPARVLPQTLVVWGGKDYFLSRRVYEAGLAMCDHGTGVWVDEATHWVHLEQPARVTPALLQFLGDRPMSQEPG